MGINLKFKKIQTRFARTFANKTSVPRIRYGFLVWKCYFHETTVYFVKLFTDFEFQFCDAPPGKTTYNGAITVGKDVEIKTFIRYLI